jgi:hypothetical protein
LTAPGEREVCPTVPSLAPKHRAFRGSEYRMRRSAGDIYITAAAFRNQTHARRALRVLHHQQTVDCSSWELDTIQVRTRSVRPVVARVGDLRGGWRQSYTLAEDAEPFFVIRSHMVVVGRVLVEVQFAAFVSDQPRALHRRVARWSSNAAVELFGR